MLVIVSTHSRDGSREWLTLSMIQVRLLTVDGAEWTSVKKIAAAINISQDNGGGMVVLYTNDAESFEQFCIELAGICTEQNGTHCSGRVREYQGSGTSAPWAIQLCLLP